MAAIEPFVFPKWFNSIRTWVAIVGGGVALYAVGLVTFGFSPQAVDVGYRPDQPIPYSHAIHAGKLGMDCRYCHTTVETAAHAAIPPIATCINCHATIRKDSPVLKPLQEAYTQGKPVEWVRVHDLPDYVYFNHSAHVRRGVGCVSCHGRIDRMEVVQQAQPLSMQWCLDCHRNPNPNLRPTDMITQMDWKPDPADGDLGAKLRAQYNINPSTDCSTCHR